MGTLEYYQKNELYKKLLEPNKIDYSKILSRKLLPDEAILSIKDKVLCIVERKSHENTRFVYEDLQACNFRNQQYKKLFAPLDIAVKYVYILSDYFRKKEYKDVLDYVKSVGCYYFFNKLPMEFLDCPENLQ
ncbi:MAG: hypothetical protein KJ706_03055 [Candidatus Omnitrophica bacterium]|nr:hypothetical protein [Candidatus Omnitrophota bacterium]